MENEIETSTFRNGEIYGIRNVLKRIETLTDSSLYNPRNYQYGELLIKLIELINAFPTVEETGSFDINKETGLVAFTYKKKDNENA